MIFPTKYDRINRSDKEFISNPGNKFRIEYQMRVNEDGSKSLVEVGKTDIQAEIQAYADQCDINLLMKRFSMGDTDVLNQRSGEYIDCRDMPTTYAELFNRVEDCKRLFNELPADLKSLFSNSYTEFWSTYGSNEFDSRISEYRNRFVDNSFSDNFNQEMVGENNG